MVGPMDIYRVGDLDLTRVGYGAMQLAGPGVFGPPKDRDAAIAVLRAAVELGIRHIDTADFYGPYVTNELIREALAPYPDDLHIVTKVGARRDDTGGGRLARPPPALTAHGDANPPPPRLHPPPLGEPRGAGAAGAAGRPPPA